MQVGPFECKWNHFDSHIKFSPGAERMLYQETAVTLERKLWTCKNIPESWWCFLESIQNCLCDLDRSKGKGGMWAHLGHWGCYVSKLLKAWKTIMHLSVVIFIIPVKPGEMFMACSYLLFGSSVPSFWMCFALPVFVCQCSHQGRFQVLSEEGRGMSISEVCSAAWLNLCHFVWHLLSVLLKQSLGGSYINPWL